MIAAKHNGIEIDVPEFNFPTENKTKAYLKKNPMGKVPTLETPEGSIFESNAIARYVARLRPDLGLYGQSFFESGLVDQWMDFCAHEIDVPMGCWLYPVLGISPFNAAATAKAKEDIKKALQVLENHLLLRTYLVGDRITLADITVASSLVYAMKFIFDAGFRKQFPCVVRWFLTLVNQPTFQSVVGDVPLCDKMMTAAGDNSTPKTAKKDSKKKASTKKEAAPVEPAKPKKVEHPLAVLNREKPTSMILDAWKVQYSNTKPLVKAMDWFWANLDKEGYSIWFCDYNYNQENVKMFMTCNAVGGFIQRSEAMRKYSFGVMSVLGEEGKGPIEITGCWLFRGQTEKHMLEANPDAEYYTWKKVDTYDDATKQKILEYWCNEETLLGKTLADSKVFK